MSRRKPAPRQLFALFDKDGEWAGTYGSAQAAHDDAWGPRFERYTVRKYQLACRRARKRKVIRTKGEPL